MGDVRFGSKADMDPRLRDVCFTPNSGHWDWPAQGLLQLASHLRMAIMELERYRLRVSRAGQDGGSAAKK